MKCPIDATHDCISPFRRHYCEAISAFDERRLLENWHPSYFLVVNFIHRFNRRVLEKDGLDPVTVLIACEIWLHNIGGWLERHPHDDCKAVLSEETARTATLPKCNAYSLAQSMGLPHQTVRRKVLLLIEKGLVARSKKGELSITADAENRYAPEVMLETMREFVGAAKTVFAMLDISPLPTTSAKPSCPREDSTA